MAVPAKVSSALPSLLDQARAFEALSDDEKRRRRSEANAEPTRDFPDPRKNLREALIPPRFRGVMFDRYDPKTKSQELAFRTSRTFLERAQQRVPTMLALIGPQGTGKSHLLYSVVDALIEAGVTGSDLYVRPWYRLADELRYGGPMPFNAGARADPADVRIALWSKSIVCLDEVRPTASTAFDDTELAKFACHAYDANLAVLITTNVTPLEAVMGPAAASRFTQVTIDGPDQRQL